MMYLLLKTVNREIKNPVPFDSSEDAFLAMRDDVLESDGYFRDNYEHDRMENGTVPAMDGRDYCITKTTAYANSAGGSFMDWKIVQLDPFRTAADDLPIQ